MSSLVPLHVRHCRAAAMSSSRGTSARSVARTRAEVPDCGRSLRGRGQACRRPGAAGAGRGAKQKQMWAEARPKPATTGWDFPSEQPSCCFKSLLIQREVNQRPVSSSHKRPRGPRRISHGHIDVFVALWWWKSCHAEAFPVLESKRVPFSHQHKLSAVVASLSLTNMTVLCCVYSAWLVMINTSAYLKRNTFRLH